MDQKTCQERSTETELSGDQVGNELKPCKTSFPCEESTGIYFSQSQWLDGLVIKIILTTVIFKGGLEKVHCLQVVAATHVKFSWFLQTSY